MAFKNSPCDDADIIDGPDAAFLRHSLTQAVEQGASDLHVVAGHRPTLRLHGRLQELPGAVLSDECVKSGLIEICPEANRDQFRQDHNADFALEIKIGGQPRRFRANYFMSGRTPGACFRVVPAEIPNFDWAGFPADLAVQLAHFRNGLVLISGVSGAGKTTTLAMIINLLAREGDYRVLTIEEPIEYVFPRCGNSIVTQREVGRDVVTFADGLKYGVRQDPDVILVGEIRDRETAQMALSAAETGHLVFSTLHSRDAKGAISRFADLFPQIVQSEIRAQLAMSLRAVVCQHLLMSKSGGKRELALEIMFNNAPIASAIRSGRDETIDRNILTSRAEGMIPLDESVRRLFQAGKISQETAEENVSDKGVLAR
jgi:twitching motility protein PilT